MANIFRDDFRDFVKALNDQVRLVHINHLIQAKKASGRLKDLDDIQQLQKRKKK